MIRLSALQLLLHRIDCFVSPFSRVVVRYRSCGGAPSQVVEVDEFETTDPGLRGEMTITITLADADGGTNLVAVHDGLPRGVSPTDNETGWRMALAKLAALLEERSVDKKKT